MGRLFTAICVFAAFLFFGCTDDMIGEMIMSDLQEKQAVMSGDPTKCTSLDKSDVNDCYSQIAANKKDISICSRIESPAELLLCKSDVAVAKGDPSICAQLNDDEVLDSCYMQIAEAKKDVSLCDKVRHDNSKIECLKALAISKNDVKICSRVYDMQPFEGGECYSDLAKRNGDPSMCEKAGAIWQDQCYTTVAIEEKDAKVCSRVFNPQQKEACIKSVATAKNSS